MDEEQKEELLEATRKLMDERQQEELLKAARELIHAGGALTAEFLVTFKRIANALEIIAIHPAAGTREERAWCEGAEAIVAERLGKE